MNFALILLASYIVGAIPFALLLARLKGIDIRKVGSGNVGATNVFRMVSKPLGIATFFCDALKGFVPAFVFPMLGKCDAGFFQCSELGVLCGVAAIAGHNWPVFLKFKGGKGIATSAGVLMGIAPAAVGIGLLSWILLFATSRYVSVASIGAAVIVPAAGWFLYFTDGAFKPVALILLGALAVWRHRSNIKRLTEGTEHRFEFRGQRSEGRGQRSEAKDQRAEVRKREMK